MNTVFALLISVVIGLVLTFIILFLVSSYHPVSLYTLPNINEFFPDSTEDFSDDIPKNVYTYEKNGQVSNDFKEAIAKNANNFQLHVISDSDATELLKPFGKEALDIYFKLDPINKEKFIAYATMLLNGGYYINRNTVLTNDISKLQGNCTLYCDTNSSVKMIVSKKRNPIFYDLLQSSSSQFYINDMNELSHNVKKMEENPVCNTSISNSCNTTYTSKIEYNKETFALYNKFGKNWLNKHVNQVYVIAMPNRIEYMTDFMKIINQKKFEFVDPIDKTTVHNPYQYTKNLNLNAGKIACHLSHVKALKTFLESPHKTCFIFEDDLILPEGLNVEVAVNDFFSNVPSDWEILFLGRCWDWCHDSVIFNKYVCSNPRPLCRHAYVVNKSGAKKLVDYTNIMYMEAGDHMYADLIRKGILKSYSPYESLFRQNRTTLSTQVMYTSPNAVTCAPTSRNNKTRTIAVISTRDLTITERYQFADNKRVAYYYIVQSPSDLLENITNLEKIGLSEALKEKYSDEYIIVKREDNFIFDEQDVIRDLHDIKDLPKYEVLNRNVNDKTKNITVKLKK